MAKTVNSLVLVCYPSVCVRACVRPFVRACMCATCVHGQHVAAYSPGTRERCRREIANMHGSTRYNGYAPYCTVRLNDVKLKLTRSGFARVKRADLAPWQTVTESSRHNTQEKHEVCNHYCHGIVDGCRLHHVRSVSVFTWWPCPSDTNNSTN
jgi:hypothetical protein